MNSSLMISELKETAKFSKTGANIISLILQVKSSCAVINWMAGTWKWRASSITWNLSRLSLNTQIYAYMPKGPYTRARKNASKTSRGKNPAATQVRKIKIESCFLFAIANKITTFSKLRSCNQEKQDRSMDKTYCLPSYQIPPVFLNYLSITNNNGVSMSKVFTSK